MSRFRHVELNWIKRSRLIIFCFKWVPHYESATFQRVLFLRAIRYIPNSIKVALANGHWQLDIGHLGKRNTMQCFAWVTANNSFPMPNCPMPKATFIELGIYISYYCDFSNYIYRRRSLFFLRNCKVTQVYSCITAFWWLMRTKPSPQCEW